MEKYGPCPVQQASVESEVDVQESGGQTTTTEEGEGTARNEEATTTEQ